MIVQICIVYYRILIGISTKLLALFKDSMNCKVNLKRFKQINKKRNSSKEMLNGHVEDDGDEGEDAPLVDDADDDGVESEDMLEMSSEVNRRLEMSTTASSCCIQGMFCPDLSIKKN